MSTATKQNAESIRDLTNRADVALREAHQHLTNAVLLAGNDYAHNDDKLKDLLATVRLIGGLVALEHSVWRDYARNRTT